jgi:hypothetical protein
MSGFHGEDLSLKIQPTYRRIQLYDLVGSRSLVAMVPGNSRYRHDFGGTSYNSFVTWVFFGLDTVISATKLTTGLVF